jgi:prepilin-type N-terminal cleavage/methylation domain-containing protein
MKPIRNREQQRGMTLAEVLVAMAIFAIIFVAALMIYDRSNKVFKTGVESAELQQNTRVAFDKMLQEIRMAGYDYDRDGFPTAAGEAQQPDEQIEYAGPGAITFRANLDFDEPPTVSDRGREKELESPNSQFPVVTTGNDEIVTYALESQTGTNPDTITFFADVTDGTNAKRQAFPGPSGAKEDKIEIKNVDLCIGGCNNPPYTLMRITLDGKGQPVRTPLANNIRSMQFQYFADASGAIPLTITDPGGGQFDPENPGASATPRAERARIRGIGVTIVGMSEAPDFSYTDPTEPLKTSAANFTNFRKYRLETLVVARNLGKRGLREQQQAAPGAPTLDRVYFGLCGAVTLEWTAPPANVATGSVESYSVLWDKDVTAPISDRPDEAKLTGIGTSYTLGGLEANTEYRFTVAAVNSWGTTYAEQVIKGTPLNGTTPDAPTDLVATGAGAGGAALPNHIELSWTRPTTNAAGQITCKTPTGTCAGESPGDPYPGETRGYEIHRSTEQNFTPGPGTKVGETSGPAISFIDTTAANCTPYYYRIRLVEHCAAAGNMNVSGNTATAVSAYHPLAAEPAVPGMAQSEVAPTAPTSLTVLDDSTCTGVNCEVHLQWPEVKTDAAGDLLAIDKYKLYITQNGGLYTGLPSSPILITPSTGLMSDGEFASYKATVKKQKDEDNTPYQYEFMIAAVNCTTEGAQSPPASFPKCDFAGEAKPVVLMGGAMGGNGTSGAPFQIEADSTITFTTDIGAPLTEVRAIAYDAATNVEVMDLGSATGISATELTLAWPDLGENEALYRIDYEITDASTPDKCSTSGSFYITNIEISCVFLLEIPSPVTQTIGDEPFVTVPLKNNTEFEIVIKKVEFDWVQEDKKLTVKSVTLPSGGTSSIAATIYEGSLTDPSANPTVIATAPAGILTLKPSDTTGNYKIGINFTTTGNFGATENMVTRVHIHYKLSIDPEALEPRECTVFP